MILEPDNCGNYIIQEPFINKPCVSSGVCEHDKQKVLDKIRAEISEYGSIWVQYQIYGRSDKDIQQLVTDVLKQAKEQVLDIIDKYKTEVDPQGSLHTRENKKAADSQGEGIGLWGQSE